MCRVCDVVGGDVVYGVITGCIDFAVGCVMVGGVCCVTVGVGGVFVNRVCVYCVTVAGGDHVLDVVVMRVADVCVVVCVLLLW